MVMRDEQGNVIITTQTRKEYQDQTVAGSKSTVSPSKQEAIKAKLMESGYTRFPVISPKSTTSKIDSVISAQRQKIASTQEFEVPLDITVSQQQVVKPTQVKSPLSIKETVFKDVDTSPSQSVTPSYVPPSQSLVDIPLSQEGLIKEVSKVQHDVVTTPFVPPLEKAKAVMDLQGVKQEVSGFPTGTTFTPVENEKGEQSYDVNIPETVKLDWAKHYRKEADSLPPVVSEVAHFGQGLFSSMAALAKPVADVLGIKQFDQMATLGMSVGTTYPPYNYNKKWASSYAKGTEAGKYGIHYPSTLDIAFEPIGLSPKGSSEFVRGNPFYAAGGIGGEVAQAIGFSAALKPVSSGIKIGTKAVVKKIPSVYSKFSKVFPEEKLIRPTVRKTTDIIARGQSDLPSRLFKWGGKGYQFGRKVIPYAPKKLDEAVKGALYSKNVSQKTIIGGGKRVVKTLMSPDEYRSAEKTLAKYLSKKPTYDIMFPRSAEGLQPFVHKSSAYHVTWRGKLARKSSYLYSGITPEGKIAFSSKLPSLEKAYYNIPSKYGGHLKDFKVGQSQIHDKFSKPWSGVVMYDDLVKKYPSISIKTEKTSDVLDLIKGSRKVDFKFTLTPDTKTVVYRHGIARRGISPEWADEVSRLMEKGYWTPTGKYTQTYIKGTGKPLMKDITSLAQKEQVSWLNRQKMRFWSGVSGIQQVIPKPTLTHLKTGTSRILSGPVRNLGRGAVSLPSKSIMTSFGLSSIGASLLSGVSIRGLSGSFSPKQNIKVPSGYIPKRDNFSKIVSSVGTSQVKNISGSSKQSVIPQVIVDFKQGLTPYERQLAEHIPSSGTYQKSVVMKQPVSISSKKSMLLKLPTYDTQLGHKKPVVIQQPISSPRDDTISIKFPISDVDQKTKLDSWQGVDQVFDPVQVKKQVTIHLPTIPPSFVKSPVKVPVVPFIPRTLYGKGRRFYGDELFGKKKRFRKIDFANPFESWGM